MQIIFMRLIWLKVRLQAAMNANTKEESQFTNCDVLFSAAFKWLKFTGAAFKKKSFET